MLLKIRIFVLLAVLCSTISLAEEKPEIRVIPLKNLRAVIDISQIPDCNIKLRMKCNGGETVYSWESKDSLCSFRRIFDFNYLQKGNYNLLISCNGSKMIKPICIENEKVTIKPTQQLFDPYFKYENERLKLSFLNFAQEPVLLNVYDKNGLITTQNLGNDMNIQKYIDFSALYAGEYDVVLKDYFAEYNFKIRK